MTATGKLTRTFGTRCPACVAGETCRRVAAPWTSVPEGGTLLGSCVCGVSGVLKTEKMNSFLESTSCEDVAVGFTWRSARAWKQLRGPYARLPWRRRGPAWPVCLEASAEKRRVAAVGGRGRQSSLRAHRGCGSQTQSPTRPRPGRERSSWTPRHDGSNTGQVRLQHGAGSLASTLEHVHLPGSPQPRGQSHAANTRAVSPWQQPAMSTAAQQLLLGEHFVTSVAYGVVRAKRDGRHGHQAPSVVVNVSETSVVVAVNMLDGEKGRRLRNAVIIQSFIRGYRDRKQQYSIQRSAFDRCAGSWQSTGTPSTVSGPSLALLVRQLLFFYRQNEDSDRLIWLYQNLVRHSSVFVKQLDGSERLTCLFQIKRLMSLCCRLLQNCNDDSLNVALPMRMLEVFSSENTYLPVLQDAGYVVSVIEQVLHYMIQNGYYKSLYLLINSKLPSSIEHSDLSRVPIAKTLLENVLKPLHFTYSSCPEGARQQVFTAFTEELLAAPFTDQIFHFVVPALADVQTVFPYEPFLNALLRAESGSSARSAGAPRLFYFVLTVGENYLGALSEEGLLVYLRVLQTFLSQLPVSPASTSCQDSASDSEEEGDEANKPTSPEDGRLSTPYITEECLKKLDTKQQTNTLLSLVWRDSASEDVFTVMASVCHTLMVQHRMMVPKVRQVRAVGSAGGLHGPQCPGLVTWQTLSRRVLVISRGSPMSFEDSSRIIPLFYLFSSLFSHSLVSIHDNEFFGDAMEGQRRPSMMPFTLEELVMLSRCLRDACLGIIKLAYPETKPEVRQEYVLAFQSIGVTTSSEMQQCIQVEQKRWIQLFKVITNLVKMLKSRDTRRNFCPPNHWLSEQEDIKADKVSQLYVPASRHVWSFRRMGRIGPLQSALDVDTRQTCCVCRPTVFTAHVTVPLTVGSESPPLSVSEERQLAVLTELPFVVPFEERVKIFQRLIYADKQEVQGDGPFLDGINVTIRRNYIYEDAYDKLSPENGNGPFLCRLASERILGVPSGSSPLRAGVGVCPPHVAVVGNWFLCWVLGTGCRARLPEGRLLPSGRRLRLLVGSCCDAGPWGPLAVLERMRRSCLQWLCRLGRLCLPWLLSRVVCLLCGICDIPKEWRWEPDLKKRIRVHLLNAHGLDEAGIDGGGIFREFLNELLKSGFNPNQGLFKTTNEGLLYPNPAAQMLVGDSFARHYYFLGRVLGKVKQFGRAKVTREACKRSPVVTASEGEGCRCQHGASRSGPPHSVNNRRTDFNVKPRARSRAFGERVPHILTVDSGLWSREALYENMLVELPFAGFFLSKLLGTSADVDIHHLASLDPEVYKNLLFLKSYEDDVEELGLNFTVVNNDLGEAQVVELKFGGKDIPVTSANRIAYIHLVADYRLNKQIRQHCLAFRQGLANVVNLEWLRMFDQQEIQVLISGAQVPISLEDLKSFTNYSGGYSADHPVIKLFWRVVEGFTDEEKRKLLKFVTSCSRPPLLGFKELYPAFCIHHGGSDLERLPTASTCMNLLKLPEFHDEALLRSKLLYAIECAAGFELS
ncbi:Ubiquitin-protein ligase E3C [Tupaia chinensis]|uniref:HECT-type E3 ubiquitin transferase n=1 Tax=Tupaia chinensis TaxID=246437 RepID=L9L406_TUPCH|nr:Ubiquitin-protein ligase E3C [Tupaia chinensis]